MANCGSAVKSVISFFTWPTDQPRHATYTSLYPIETKLELFPGTPSPPGQSDKPERYTASVTTSRPWPIQRTLRPIGTSQSAIRRETPLRATLAGSSPLLVFQFDPTVARNLPFGMSRCKPHYRLSSRSLNELPAYSTRLRVSTVLTAPLRPKLYG
jgi:hypothetical protein